MHEKIIGLIYARCRDHGVLLEGVEICNELLIDSQRVIPGSLLKPSFPQPGLKHASRASTTAKDIALATAAVISRSVPSAVAGVVFLSGNVFLSCDFVWVH